jgi:Mg-chelatase subunit ChlD
VTSDLPEGATLSKGEDFCFIFIVDRSGSMERGERMEITKDALKLFIQSLPVGSQFAILSFGYESCWCENKK